MYSSQSFTPLLRLSSTRRRSGPVVSLLASMVETNAVSIHAGFMAEIRPEWIKCSRSNYTVKKNEEIFNDIIMNDWELVSVEHWYDFAPDSFFGSKKLSWGEIFIIFLSVHVHNLYFIYGEAYCINKHTSHYCTVHQWEYSRMDSI